MEKLEFVYVTYIATTPEKLWEALVNPEFNRQYWFGFHQESDWKEGSSWSAIDENGDVWDTGKVLAVDPPRRLQVSWRHVRKPELQETGLTKATFEIEQEGELVKLTVLHEAPAGGEKFIEAVSGGWPRILSSLKTLLETGAALPGTNHHD